MTTKEFNHLAHWVERLRNDAEALSKYLHAYAYADAAMCPQPTVDAQPQPGAVNTQYSNTQTAPTVNNKLKNSARECVCVTGAEQPQNTHAQFLSWDFIQLHLPEGVPVWYAAFWYRLMEQRAWQLRDGKRVNSENWAYFLGAFFARATDAELDAARAQAQQPPQRQETVEEARARLKAEHDKLFGNKFEE